MKSLLAILIMVFLIFGYPIATMFVADGNAQITPGVDNSVCYRGGDELVKAEYENTNLLITVNWFDTVEQLRAEVALRRDEYDINLEAYSECSVDRERDIGWCELWVVRPQRVIGDPHMDSLGHEVLHGLMGGFHE